MVWGLGFGFVSACIGAGSREAHFFEVSVVNLPRLGATCGQTLGSSSPPGHSGHSGLGEARQWAIPDVLARGCACTATAANLGDEILPRHHFLRVHLPHLSCHSHLTDMGQAPPQEPISTLDCFSGAGGRSGGGASEFRGSPWAMSL